MSVKLKICTFNLRTPVPADEQNYFPNRKARRKACVRILENHLHIWTEFIKRPF